MAKKELLSKEARAAKNAYMRAWQKNNPDKVREAQKRYWEKKAKEMEQKEAK